MFELRHETYGAIPLDSMPPVRRKFDGSLEWLLETPTHDRSLRRGPDDPARLDADAEGLHAIVPDRLLPASFATFIEDPEPRRHIRSATACYLDLADRTVEVSDGGILIHFLSDQQWVLHWLLYLGPDGSEAVVTSADPLGFDDGDEPPVTHVDLELAQESLAVCGNSFEEFLYRFWIENELFHRLAVEREPLDALPAELREYATGYPREDPPTPSTGNLRRPS